MKHFLYIFLVLSVFSCSKKKQAENVVEIQTKAKYRINDIYFINQTKGFAVGGDKYTEGNILRTLDAGETWQLLDSTNIFSYTVGEHLQTLYSIDFFDENIGEIVGLNGKILRTADGGNTWTIGQNGEYLNLYKVKMFSPNKTFLVSEGSILKTDEHWYYQESQDFSFTLKDIEFTNSNTAYLAGYGFVKKSVDAGETWEFLNIKGDFFYDINFVNEQVGYICGWQGGIFKTINAGETWQKTHNTNFAFSSRHHYENISFINETTGVVCGYNGEVLYTNNGAKTWQKVEMNTKTNFHSIYFLNENTFFVGGSEGQIFRVNI